ncbi:nitroreductase family protein, partial [Escherichia coli]|uniref:nitroreductase family protein n=2 Tax=Enterobacterales TaxID=91347 RepID=UPI0032D9C70C
SSFESTDKESLSAWLLQDKHRIEKALSLPEPRYNFGIEPITRLVKNLNRYSKCFNKDRVYYIAVGAIYAYIEFHEKNNTPINKEIIEIIQDVDLADSDNEVCREVGVINNCFISDRSTFFSDFVKNRYSCRNFKEQNIDEDIIKKVIKISSKTPSVCNRQHWKVHIFNDERKSKILELQNGNAG